MAGLAVRIGTKLFLNSCVDKQENLFFSSKVWFITNMQNFAYAELAIYRQSGGEYYRANN